MKIVHFADLHLGVESYGRVDPESGLASRLLDYLASFDRLVDYALENNADLVLFCGDVYKSRDPSQTQQREFARRIKRLSDAHIPVFLLVGNHDLPNAMGRASSAEIFETLGVEHVTVADKPGLYEICTHGGVIQVVALPWLKRTNLLSIEDRKNLTLDELNTKMQEALTSTLHRYAGQVKPGLPSVLAAHVWVQGARTGSEDSVTIGQEHVLLPSAVADKTFDYVALGHIHHPQVLLTNPPVVYAGSLDSLDFGDEGSAKGFYVVDIAPGETGNRVNYEFVPTGGRRFITLKVDLKTDDIFPTENILRLLNEHASEIKGNIVRLELTLPCELDELLRDADIRQAAWEASYFAVTKTIKRETRPRASGVSAESVTPAQALKLYLTLNQSNYSTDRAALLTAYGEDIIRSSRNN